MNCVGNVCQAVVKRSKVWDLKYGDLVIQLSFPVPVDQDDAIDCLERGLDAGTLVPVPGREPQLPGFVN